MGRSGSSILTDGNLAAVSGPGVFFLAFRTDGRARLVSGSVSEARECFDVLFRLPGVIVPCPVVSISEPSPAMAVPSNKLVLLFRPRGVFGGGGMSSVSRSASPLTVLDSWLLGISMMPLLVRFVRARELSIFCDLESTLSVRICIKCGFFADAG